MKNSIKSYLDAVVHDNAEIIKENGGNAAEHILNNCENLEFGWFEILTEDEIHEYETASGERREEIRAEIRAFVNENYNYNLLADELLEKWIVVDFGADTEDRLRVTRRSNFEKMDLCGAFENYGRTVGCESAGCYTFSNSESSVFLDFTKELYAKFNGVEQIVDENEMTDREFCEFFIDPMNHKPGRDLFSVDIFDQMLAFFNAWEVKNTSHTEVTAWTFHDSHNFQTVVLENDYGEADCIEIEEAEQKEILLQMPQTFPHMEGFNTSEKTEDFIFRFDRWATNPWYCFVERK